MGYSKPVNKKVSKKELLDKLFSFQKVKNTRKKINNVFGLNVFDGLGKNHTSTFSDEVPSSLNPLNKLFSGKR